VTGAFSITDVYTLLEVRNVKLPQYTGTFQVDVKVKDSGGTVAGSAVAGTFVVSVTSGSLQLSLRSLDSVTVGEQVENLEISVTPSNPIPIDGRIQLKFPKWNPGTQTVAKVESMFTTNAAKDQFNVAEMGFYIDCSSSGHPNLKCIVSLATVS
jgi:hypothetical protein